MGKIKTWLFWIGCSLAAVLLYVIFAYIGVMSWWWYSSTHPKTFYLDVNAEQELTEEFVIDTSRKVLEKAGMNVKNMIPVQVYSTGFMSVNSLDPNRVSIAWATKKGTYYGINIEKEGTKLKCEI